FVLGLSTGDVSRPGDGEHRPNDRLNPFGEAGLAERHHAVEAVTIGQRHRRETELGSALGNRLWLHRSFEHGEAGKDAKRDERLSHSMFMGCARESGKHAAGTYPQISAAVASGPR